MISGRLLSVTVLLICYIKLTTGSCLNYGNSCLGAHGKRSNSGISPIEQMRPMHNSRRWNFLKPQNDDLVALRLKNDNEFLSTDGRRDKYLDEPPYAVLDSGEFDYRIDERNQIQDGSLDNGKIASFQMRRGLRKKRTPNNYK